MPTKPASTVVRYLPSDVKLGARSVLEEAAGLKMQE